MNANSQRLEELVSLWQQRAALGQTVTAEDVCPPDCPELLPELRQRIEALLVMGKVARQADVPTVDFAHAGDTGDLPRAATPAAELPAVAGYDILALLGQGGMGVVYKARHQQLGRVVALKMILDRGQAEKDELARFRTEAEAVARMQHPNIVQVFEVGEWRARDASPPRPFFSLEFCAGGSLDRKLNHTPLPTQEAARLVETLARAMQAAHQQQIIHRDLKPANVLLTAAGAPKIGDFGLAKKLDQESGQTQTGMVMGTPSYMAPEQARGEGRTLGPAVDIYALGAILYECLTGRPPFRAATTWETVAQVIKDEPVPPRRLQPKVPRDLETIALKALAKEPPRRTRPQAAWPKTCGGF